MTDGAALQPQEIELWDTWMRAQHLIVRTLDLALQRECGISKPEFSVLITLSRGPAGALRAGELAAHLDWEKSRVAHLLTRMEKRGLLEPTRHEASGRRVGVELTVRGRDAADRAVRTHAAVIRRHVLDVLSPEQAAAIRSWSTRTVHELEPPADR